jgi:hypothetical protein
MVAISRDGKGKRRSRQIPAGPVNRPGTTDLANVSLFCAEAIGALWSTHRQMAGLTVWTNPTEWLLRLTSSGRSGARWMQAPTADAQMLCRVALRVAAAGNQGLATTRADII